MIIFVFAIFRLTIPSKTETMDGDIGGSGQHVNTGGGGDLPQQANTSADWLFQNSIYHQKISPPS